MIASLIPLLLDDEDIIQGGDSVPDSGTAGLLLGIAVVATGLFARFKGKK